MKKRPAQKKWERWVIVMVLAITAVLAAGWLVGKAGELNRQKGMEDQKRAGRVATARKEERVREEKAVVEVGVFPQQNVIEKEKPLTLEIKIDTRGKVISVAQVYLLLEEERGAEMKVVDSDLSKEGVQIETGDKRFSYIINSAKPDPKRGGTLIGIVGYSLKGERAENTTLGQIVLKAASSKGRVKVSLVEELTKVILLNGEPTKVVSQEGVYQII